MGRRVQELRQDNGFTLVELLVVMVLLGVVGAIFATSVVNAMGVDRRTKQRAEISSSLTIANERMSREIRTAAPLISVSPSQLVVESFSNGQRRRFEYAYDAAAKTLTVTRSEYASPTASSPSATSTTLLAGQIVMPSGESVFIAKKRDGTATTIAKDVASVTVTLVGQPAESASVRVQTSIFLRNFQG